MKHDEHTTVTLQAVVAIGLTIVLWSGAFPGIRAALRSFSPSELAFLRFAIASLALGVYWLFARPALPRRRDWPRLFLAGVSGITAYNLLLNSGELTTSAGAASFIVNLTPMFALIIGFLSTGERVTPWVLVGTLVSFAGAATIAFGSTPDMRFDIGALFVAAAAFCFALSFVFQRPLLAHVGPIGVATAMIWVATATLVPFAPGALSTLQNASGEAIVAVVFLGVGPSMLAYVAWSHALAVYPVSRATSFLYLVPPMTLAFSFVWIGEIPSGLTIIGGILTLTGVVVVNTIGQLTTRGRVIQPRN
ncbi:DMT family transporter [Bradyrhizobium prioriisuperbiae]|uniref:DMT family transporter n=1 Tax=Bradyrhizobium prioriisuperbiae TaxID=2854389 RepID=UPI0028F0056E|nr:DMT family transporter [Bradyrhizobium prioritasuperba]